MDVYARLSPAHKKRVVQALQKKGHVVGFMGDGINDAPALRAADVGISVDNAVDIAKESADVILLEKNLMVLEEGVLEGRKVFVNILKYIRMGASSNFGNMFSVLGARHCSNSSPCMPLQILTNNLLYDFSQVPIPTDNVGAQQIAKPRPWQMGEIARFMLLIGPISSIFDYTTFAVMALVFKCTNAAAQAQVTPELIDQFKDEALNHTHAAQLFHTGWFVESLITQTLIIHVIRTNLIPFIQSRSSWQLSMTTILDHAHRRGAAVFAAGRAAGICAAAVAVLAVAGRDADLLRRPDTTHQDWMCGTTGFDDMTSGERQVENKTVCRKILPRHPHWSQNKKAAPHLTGRRISVCAG